MNKNVQPKMETKEPKKSRKLLPEKKKPTIKKDIVKDNDIVRIKGDMDRTFLILVIVMICFGSVMVFSASYAYALASKGSSYYFIEKQLFFVAAGVVGMFVVANFIDYRTIKKYTKLYFTIVMILLGVVLLYGTAEGEAQRWIYIPGTSFGIQPSEFMKLGIVLMLAKYFSENEKLLDRQTFKYEPVVRRLAFPYALVIIVCIMVALEKHFSGVIILFLIGTCVIFTAGGQLKWLLGSGGAFATLLLGVIMLVPYARGRLDIWLNPENYSSQSETWQTIQGLNAVGSGGFFGVGLGNSLQKHMFVSQPQNDFIFAIIAEELGFVGAVGTIFLFGVFIWRGLVIANRAPDSFSKLVVVGIVSKVAIQAVLNIAVVTNTIPNTGISLPFFSYGGSSLMMLLLEMGIILSISRFSHIRVND
ncbi:MAG: cell division protein FtsW [Clostridia bacterium]|nr:cell division protein FtsW [Clostridia bacterium]